jgi:hypothetical protein
MTADPKVDARAFHRWFLPDHRAFALNYFFPG